MSVRNSDMEKLSRKVAADVPDDIEFQDAELADDADGADELSDTTILEADSELSDNVGYSSVQLDVAQLLAEVEAEASKESMQVAVFDVAWKQSWNANAVIRIYSTSKITIWTADRSHGGNVFGVLASAALAASMKVSAS